MAKRRNFFYVLVVIALLVTPTAASLGFYVITQDPNLRPLGVTQEALSAYARGRIDGQVHVVAQIEWVPGNTAGYSQRAFEMALENAFRAKGVEVFVFFHDGVDRTRVNFRVGRSTIGPFSPAQAARGVTAAVDAYRMHVPVN
ncbi:MAG: hypothetical protein VX874_12470 [Pseudomonadota bacterium]|nr:hypothetical protein [Pseudomonadota bacterium]